MSEACVAVTRGGVTYQVPKPARPQQVQAFDWLGIGDASHRIAEPAAAENGNAGPPTTHASEVLGRLRNTLDLADEDDLRAGAMLAVLCGRGSAWCCSAPRHPRCCGATGCTNA
jgi:hypothetical protein